MRSKLTEGILAPLLTDGVRPLLIAGDLAACMVGVVAVGAPLLLGPVMALALIPLLSQAGLYRSRLTLSVLDDVPRIAAVWLVSVALLVLGSHLVRLEVPVAPATAAAGLVLLLFRVTNYAAVRHLRRIGWVRHGTIVVGADLTGTGIARRIEHNPESGLTTLGFLDTRPGGGGELPAPLLGGPNDLVAVLQRHQPKVLIVTQGGMAESALVALVRSCHRHRCEVLVLPRLPEITSVGDDTDFIADVPLIRLRRRAYRSWAWRLKRLLDLTVSATAVVLLSPVLLACALAVRLEGGRGVIFRQQRVGCDGRLFELLKVRSLRPVDETESTTTWNISHDDRLGPVGRFLRKTSLDELPQLFNIIRGDMSLVGPRPERPHFVAEFGERYLGYTARHRVPSGLTGWAQVHGLRGDTSIDDRARFDNFYIENWSLWLDIKILLRTAVSIVTSPGS